MARKNIIPLKSSAWSRRLPLIPAVQPLPNLPRRRKEHLRPACWPILWCWIVTSLQLPPIKCWEREFFEPWLAAIRFTNRSKPSGRFLSGALFAVFKVRIDDSANLEHGNLFLSEQRAQFVVCQNFSAIFWILQIFFFHIIPQAFHGFSAAHWVRRTKNIGQFARGC